jgi:FkbM family methyltransferase
LKFSAIPYYIISVGTLLTGIQNWGALFTLFLNKRSPQPVEINLKTGESFLVFSFLDIWILKETILDRQYALAGVEIKDGWTIIDIGAALGDFSIWAAKQDPNGRVLAAEPFPPAISLLNANLEKNHIKNVVVFEGALSNKTGEISLNTSAGETVLNSTALSQPSDQIVQVPTLMLSDFFKRYSIDHCDYLKMDCEGAEYEILFSTSDEIINKIDRICMEVHDQLTKHNRGEMINFLKGKGYLTRLTPNPVHHHIAYIYAEKMTLEGKSL